MFRVEFSTEDVRRRLAELQAEVYVVAHDALDAAVRLAAQAARSTTEFRDRTGALRQSIASGPVVGLRSFVEAGAAHASYVENGTPPHEIVAKGRSLAFVVNGQQVFARSVHHPGTRPTKFLEKAVRDVEPEFVRLLEAGLDAAARRFNS